MLSRETFGWGGYARLSVRVCVCVCACMRAHMCMWVIDNWFLTTSQSWRYIRADCVPVSLLREMWCKFSVWLILKCCPWWNINLVRVHPFFSDPYPPPNPFFFFFLLKSLLLYFYETSSWPRTTPLSGPVLLDLHGGCQQQVPLSECSTVLPCPEHSPNLPSLSLSCFTPLAARWFTNTVQTCFSLLQLPQFNSSWLLDCIP